MCRTCRQFASAVVSTDMNESSFQRCSQRDQASLTEPLSRLARNDVGTNLEVLGASPYCVIIWKLESKYADIFVLFVARSA